PRAPPPDDGAVLPPPRAAPAAGRARRRAGGRGRARLPRGAAAGVERSRRRSSMTRLPWILLALAPLCLSCAEGALPPPRAAVPVKSACTGGSRPPASVGLDVRQGRRHSEARTIFVTNLSDRARTVRVTQVARVEGACAGEWARQLQVSYVDG